MSIVAVGIKIEVNEITEDLLPSRHILAATAVYRALFGVLAARALIDNSCEPVACVQSGLNTSAYVFPVRHLVSAMEALKSELQEIGLSEEWTVVGYWCPDERIYRNWHPNPARFDLHRLLKLTDWGEAAVMLKRRAEALKAWFKSQQDQHDNGNP